MYDSGGRGVRNTNLGVATPEEIAPEAEEDCYLAPEGGRYLAPEGGCYLAPEGDCS